MVGNDNEPVEIDGMLWRPTDGPASSVDQFIAARRAFTEINNDVRWNPWVREDRADEYDAAMTSMGQWERAEADHRYLTLEELEDEWAREAQQRGLERQEADRRRQARIRDHDPGLSADRLALLEVESRHRHATEELER